MLRTLKKEPHILTSGVHNYKMIIRTRKLLALKNDMKFFII